MHCSRRTLGAALSFTLAATLAGSAVAVDAAPAEPPLLLFAPTDEVVVTVHTFAPPPGEPPLPPGEDEYVEFSAPLYLAAPHKTFAIELRRPSTSAPLTARARIGGVWQPVDPGLLDGWYGFKDALEVTWTDAAGEPIQQEVLPWCPNDGADGRLSPSGSPVSTFTEWCSSHPFSRSQRWGIQDGWATNLLGYNVLPPDLSMEEPAGLEVRVTDPLGDLLQIPAADRTVHFDVTIVRVTEGMDDPMAAGRAGGARSSTVTSASSTSPARPQAAIVGPVPTSALPDLRSLPALGITTHVEDDLDLLDFGATVYNGGQGPLVVEGFRRAGEAVMDAHQSFYADGRLVGTSRVGEMEYDDRATHQHWHFRDFAQYDLIDAQGQQVATSGKEAFCLAPTDAIDLLLPGAVVNPGNQDLNTACGDASAIWVREVLASGWGDTYTQFRAGQSIDITDLPNGTYRIRIVANPEGRLVERAQGNNVALRTVILGGVAGERTVDVPPHNGIDTEGGFGFRER